MSYEARVQGCEADWDRVLEGFTRFGGLAGYWDLSGIRALCGGLGFFC